MDLMIPKPIDFETLRQTIEKILRGLYQEG